MLHSLHVLLIDFERLLVVPGSDDRSLLEELRPALQEEDEASGERDDDDEEEPLTSLRAFETLLADTIPEGEWRGEAYAIALAQLYGHIANGRDVIELPGGLGWVDTVDAALKTAGAQEPFTLSSLIYRGAPFPVPETQEPMLGYLTTAEVRDAFTQYDGISLMKMPVDIRRAVERFGVWLRSANDGQLGLVGIFA